MRWFWHTFIVSFLVALRPEVVVEVGSEHGDVTVRLLDWADERGAVVHAIDPMPTFDVAALQAAHGDTLRFHRAVSLNVLSEIPGVDLVLLDGDHNWYTVVNELRQLERRALSDGRLPPVVLLHDVGWPYARRDLYYDPATIPAEHRHEHALRGLRPGDPGLHDPGLNADLHNAVREGGAANGVLTAVEDFISESALDWSLTTVPGLFSLGILAPEQLLGERADVREAIASTQTADFLRRQCEEIEAVRIDVAMQAAAQAADAERAGEANATEHERLEAELRRTREVYRERDEELSRIRDAYLQRDAELGEAERAVEEREVELTLRLREIDELHTELHTEHDRDAGTIAGLSGELEAARSVSAEMTGSITWKAYRSARNRVFAALGGAGSLPVRMIQATVRGAARLAGGGARTVPDEIGAPEAPRQWAPVLLPEFAEPVASLVIPLYTGAELTAACLSSIVEHTSRIGYEVIIVDDGADPDTKALLAQVQGARIFVNDVNIGYLRSVNRGAAAARGEWIVLCNNDIEVRDGWLTAMLQCGRSSPDVGVVTPKYLYPDGSLNEAGAIIWRDGTGMNYGRGQNPGLFHYGFRREVDYGSAAALMVRASLWANVGGFDELFLPMYYEDVDLCFQARDRGMRVMYEPRATVVHVEGGTAGTDITSGHKRHQEINRARFVQKWHARMPEQQRPGTPNLRLAANRARGPRVLIADHRVPMWDRDAGSLRMKAIIDALGELGCRVALLPDNGLRAEPYCAELERGGVEIWAGDVNVNGELKAIGPGLELAIVSRPHTASRWLDLIRELAPTAAVVYDTVDLHWLREARRDGGRDGRELVRGSKAAALRELELALIRACDATLVVHAAERAIVQADVPDAAVWIVPTIHTVRQDTPPVASREGVILIGGFEHPPNTEAAVRLVRQVMPIVWRRLGPVPVTIVGGSAPQEVLELASGDVEVTGWLPEVDSVLDRARVMLAPLTWGAGLKGKVTQALAAGLPVVTTPIGAEGLDATDGDQLLIAEDDDELAQRVIRALTDDELWMSLSVAGKELTDSLCSPRVVRQRLEEILEAGPELKSGGRRDSRRELTSA
jgi:GT2 family glycosyltransferase/glycosyltransferase involved in cell wall biosynthesis